LCQNESVGRGNREAEFVYVQFFMFIHGYGYTSYSLLNEVHTSRGRGVGGSQCGCVYRIFLITASFGYFKTIKEPSGFMKEPANYCQVCNLN
jgi:hypothetical protein